ncbi:hypothetical protein KR200_007400, partial [Drosophila serrata]
SAPADKPDFVRRSTTPLMQEGSKDSDHRSPEIDTYSISSASTPSPGKPSNSSNSLEEARKKLAALRGGAAATGQDHSAMALASNKNDPRGKKQTLVTALPKHDSNTSSNNVGNVTPPPMVRIMSPIPPAPSMKPSPSSWYTFGNIPSGNVSKTSSTSSSISQEADHSPMSSRSYGSDSWRSFNGSESWDPRRENHNPRDPRMGRNQSSHGPQQHQSHTLPYSGDLRRGNGTYANMDESNHWPSTSNGTGNANKYTKPNWGANPSANPNHIPVSAFNSSASSRGGFRGGSHNPTTMGRFGRPNAGPACNGSAPEAGHPNYVARTYREHREAKAREAKAKLAEELRQLEADKQRLLEAVQKETPQDKDKGEAEAAIAASPAGPASAQAGPVTEPQLDTLYRNSTGASCKKIDFRIPKKSPAVASSPSSVNGESDVNAAGSGSSTPRMSPSKSCDARKVSDNNSHKSNNKDKEKDMEVTKTDEEIKDKEKSKTKKHHKKADKKGRNSSKEHKKRADKDKGKEKEKEKSSSSHDALDTDSVTIVASSENNENLENEPPVEEVSPINGPSPALSEESDEKLDAMAVLRGAKKIPPLVNGEVMEKGVENNVVDDSQEGEADEEKAEPPKLSKMKIVLGPNAHSTLLHGEKSTIADNANPLASKDTKMTSDFKALELFTDKHDDTEVPAPPLQELRRIMKRRYSMVPKASQPLVDKEEILTGGSLLYEDLQEQKRQTQRARHLAHIFEKTSDNCRISTQNIITGKRRTRGAPESSFNETQLSRRCFGLGSINKSKRSEKTKATTSSAAADLEISEPPKATMAPAATDVALIEPSTSSEATSRKRRRSVRDAEDKADVAVLSEDHQQQPQPPPARKIYKRRPKRNELDKLNDDIAMMYYGEDVLRATGRRACTQRSRTPSMPRVSPPTETNNSRSSHMSPPIIIRNVARRGKRFHGPSSLNSGLNRATVLAQKQRCTVKILRNRILEQMVREGKTFLTEEELERPAKRRRLSETSDPMDIRNVNPEWHATSAATSSCVVCNVNIRKSPLLHYIQNHGEHYGARLPPGMLDELRAGRNQRPDYKIAQGAVQVYYYKCPFCVKVINMRALNLAEHLITHTGERRYQCSHCLMALHRLHIMQDHIKTCAPDATVVKHDNCGILPISLNVCHLCNFVQVSEDHMNWHLQTQHGLLEADLQGLKRERVLLCTLEGVPRAASLAEGQKIVKRNQRNAIMDTTDPKPKAAGTSTKAKTKAAGKVSKKNSKDNDNGDDDERPCSFKAAKKKTGPKKKVKIRFQNKTKKSLRSVKREKEDETEDQKECKSEPLLGSQGEILPETNAEAPLATLPLPPPEKEELPVVNECLMDHDMTMALEEIAEEEQALQDKDQNMLVEKKPLENVDMDTSVNVGQEVAEGVKNDDEKPPVESANLESIETESEKATKAPMEAEPEEAATTEATKPKTLLNPDLSLSELDADLLDGIGSDASDVEVNFDNDPKIEEPQADDWIDLETAEDNRKAPKNPFQSFSRFCSRLNKGSRSGRSGTNGSTSGSSNDGQDSPDPSELMPRMRPLEPETTSTTSTTPTSITIKTQKDETPPSQSSAAVTPSSPVAVPRKSPLKRVENVAYRKGGVGPMAGQCAAYYCIYPGCTFLFSNELEGLENHFAQEHPKVRWTGTCALCPRGRKNRDPQPHNIADELRHMTEEHMNRRRSVTFEVMDLDSNEPAESAAGTDQPLFKLRVRRFTGDRLAEPQTGEESQSASGAVAAPAPEAAATAITAGEDQPNGMLRGLLRAEPRPPNQVDFNAAGLGEFLCVKSTTTPEEPAINTTTGTTSEQPTVINYPSGLGLAISQVFNGSSVPLSVLNTPTPASSVAAPKPPPAHLNVPVFSDSGTRVVPDRFRCMAPNCGFCAHTVMCIREHMRIHRFSFASNGYLNCAYCNHIATDVDDYIRHGVVVHNLAPNSDLHGIPAETPSVSQQIRDMLNQRSNVTLLSKVQDSTLLYFFPFLFKHCTNQETPVPEDKLYACPQKGCIVRLTEEQFVNHVRYHIRSSLNQGSDQVKCKYCAQTLLPPALRTHLQQAHARHKLFCSICLATAANKRLMLYHVRIQHSQEFELVNRQLQFIQLPTEPDAAGVAKGVGGTAAAALVADVNSIFLTVVVQPFGKQEMERFQRRLLEELMIRRQGTKTVYRGSEVRLLPRIIQFPEPIRCAECNFSSNMRSLLQRHLYEHKEKVVREAYQLEESQPAVAAEEEIDVVSVGEDDPTESTGGAAEAQVETPSVRPPGKHNAVKPKLVYVPPDKRYRCGFSRCIRLLGTELELRHHMTVDHCYSEETFCHHCKLPLSGQSSVDKYLGHLMLHKRHIYQCGACMRYNNKRSTIERHIHERHPLHEVDVVIHRHSDTHLTTSARWLKAAKTTRLTHLEYICNLCQLILPTAVQIMAHAVAVHDRKYQYHCPYCIVGNKDGSEVIDHILSSHPGRRVQPVQVFQQISHKKSQTVGFYCIVCLKGANSCLRIGQHCDEMHKSRFQWQCPHCEFGHQQERIVSQHLEMSHPKKIGLAVMQFERVTTEIPDIISWELGQPIVEDEPEPVKVAQTEVKQAQNVAANVAEGQPQPQPQPETKQQKQPEPKQAELVITEVVDLLASDDERDDHESSESQEEQKIVEFACTHCGETNGNLQDLRTQHWAHAHPDQPFYFRVQPQLLCSECKRFRSNAKTLRDDHLLKVHSIRNIVACDVRRPEECAYCEYKYQGWQDLAHHISREGHLPNDLKNVTDDELAALQQLSACGTSGEGTVGAQNEYYQCDLCSVVMPTKGAIAQHGRVEHNKPGERFCFRQLTTPLIYHCFFCMFTSGEELTTLRHMVDHYNRFLYCHFCAKHLPGGFDEYIQHCYSQHREDVHRFRELHSYGDLRKFLINVHYQFQNGLIITKSSLRRTRFNDEYMMKALYTELMAKVQRPPIRLHINLKSVQGQQPVHGQQPVQRNFPVQAQEQMPSALRSHRINQRRKTLNPSEMLSLSRQDQSSPHRP